jgi:hypothetical protein
MNRPDLVTKDYLDLKLEALKTTLEVSMAVLESRMETRMEKFVLKRELGMMWKFMLLLGAQWAAISWMMQHWRP